MQTFCPVLGRPSSVRPTAFSHGPWQLVRCEETGFVFLQDPPSYDEVATEFAWEKTFEQEKQSRENTEPAVQKLSKRFKDWRTHTFRNRNRFLDLTERTVRDAQEVQVLDVGTGRGHRIRSYCQALGQRGIQAIPSGIEISAELSKIADDLFRPLGGRVVTAPAMLGVEQFPESSFDIVVMSCYLEHEARPLEVLQRIRPAIKEDGVILIKVPNFNSLNRYWRQGRWCGFRYPDHVNYFTPRTLRLLAEQAEYEMLPQSWSDRLPTSDNMYAVFQRPPASVSLRSKAA